MSDIAILHGPPIEAAFFLPSIFLERFAAPLCRAMAAHVLPSYLIGPWPINFIHLPRSTHE
jgi:hypothetical protein